MTESQDQPRPDDADDPTDGDTTDADAAIEAVSQLGDTDDERLEAVAEHNRSLEERLPGDDELPLTKG